MLEFILLFIFFYFVINSFSRRKARRKPRTLDAELRALIQDHNTNTGIALGLYSYENGIPATIQAIQNELKEGTTDKPKLELPPSL